MKNFTDIICILDRSGSMETIKTDVLGGFNSFLEQQKQVEGDARISVVLFDNEYNMLYENIDIKKAQSLTTETYVPRATTALYDSVGITLDRYIDMLSNTPFEKRADKVLCVIATDGLENASRKYSQQQIKEMIEEMRNEFHWEFIFLAANQDAMLTATSMGISAGNSLNFAYSGDGVKAAYSTMSNVTSKYRCASASTKTDSLIADEEPSQSV
jgi:hypothetical protein